MEPIKHLLARKSHNQLVAPAPSDEQLKILFASALRAPDHALLRPWRYRVFQDEGLERLGELFARASELSNPALTLEQLDKLQLKPKRAPMVIVASVAIVEHPKVPEIEQVLSGGASVQNLLMAAHFQNIGAIWRTGSLAFDPNLRPLLDCEDNEIIIGFIYLGTELGEKRKAKPVVMEEHVLHC